MCIQKYIICIYSAILVAIVAADNPHSEEISERIVGGQYARAGQFPYQASLRDAIYRDFHFCGGAIVHKFWVLTAGHCVNGRDADDLFINLGSLQVSDGGMFYDASRIVKHPGFIESTLKNDIAMIRIDEGIEFNQFVQPIELNIQYIRAGVDVVASGWGDTNKGGPASNQLKYVNMTSITNSACRARNFRKTYLLHDTVLCVYSGRQGQGTCNGDSGGPLASNGLLIGAVSWGEPCALGYPDAFTRISSFATWIRANIDSTRTV